ncbi:Ribokinase-like protein [Podospora didyma]|uniref:Ribokinase-like protein n=1 Tax=Podospora didyma TaxID=330526 RepID=A0AAE0KKQ2_9PEZI|nr:Ribokinase-like protein [Podospora didyma]
MWETGSGSITTTTMQKNLILIGACYLDTILTVPHFPAEDSKLRATAVQVRRGGNCPNTLEVLQQLLYSDSRQQQQQHGPRTTKITPHLVSCLPQAQAAATRTIVSSFGGQHQPPGQDEGKENMIDFSHCLFREGHDEAASSYIIRSAETGSRTIVNFNDLPEMTFGEFQMIADKFATTESGADCWWHFEGRIPETTLQCIRYLRQVIAGSTISVEVEKPGRQGLVELATESDVVFYSQSWATARGYTSAEECLKGEAPSTRASLMLGTWGAEGASALWLPSGEYMHCPANPSGKELLVVDTLGAGDTFIAGMLYGLICHADDWSQKAKLTFAVELATEKVQREGFAGLAP